MRMGSVGQAAMFHGSTLRSYLVRVRFRVRLRLRVRVRVSPRQHVEVVPA